MAKIVFASLVVCLLLPSVSGDLQAAVLRFDTAEVSLQSNQTFDGSQGTPNPFTAIDLSADVTSPSGRTYSISGFFDGNGQGGAVGRVFKLRIFADEEGTWRWTTRSNEPSLHGKSGSFVCAGLLPGRFAAGPLEIDPERPRIFRYRNGTPVYLLGKFLDADAPEKLRFSHTFWSEDLTDADRQTLLDRHLSMRLNKMSVYLANKGDYAHVSTTPWVGRDTSNDKTRFDLARWHRYDRWTRELRDAGLLAHLWFFADDSQFGDLPEADRQRLIRYGMARLSGYVNTLFTLALEWQEGWTSAEVANHMGYLHQNNPWDRLISVHGLTGHFSFPTEPWADYMQVQAGNQSDFQDVWTSTLVHRLMGEKPVIQEEHGLGQEDAAHRRKAWAAFVGGSSGSGTGAFLEPLARFLPGTPFERMEPDDLVVLTGNAWALADRGRHYVLYLHDGGSVTVDLLTAPGTFLAEWFDPRTGLFTPLTTVTGGSLRSFTAPGAGDWVLTLRLPPGSGESSAPADFYTLPPCRVLDTRTGEGALRSGERRPYRLAGTCGIPPTARAVAINLTVVQPTGSGSVTLWPGDRPLPLTSSLNFGAGSVRANHAVLPLGQDGTVLAQPFVAGSGAAHLVVDVSGYFE
jgi:hypothetical protein